MTSVRAQLLPNGHIRIQRSSDLQKRAENAAKLWYENAHRNGLQNLHGEPDEGEMERKTDGAVTEAHLADFIELPWHVGTKLRQPDIGNDIMVRSTRVPDGHLIAFQYEPDNYRFVLAIPYPTFIDYVGWAPGWEVKRPEFWNRQPDKKRPCFWNPQRILSPMLQMAEVNRAITREDRMTG